MALSTNTVANATDISPSFARTTGPMAAIALPPQIAVPELGSVDFSGDKFVSLMKNPLFYHMENDYLNILASIVLPVQMLLLDNLLAMLLHMMEKKLFISLVILELVTQY